jgi:hypothetical protein
MHGKRGRRAKSSIRIDNFFDDPADDARDLVLLSDPKAVHAVFVGQFYSNAELDALLNVSRTLLGMGKSLVLHYFGQNPAATNPGYQLIAHGALPRDELVANRQMGSRLAAYPTEERFIETSTLSFPSKSRITSRQVCRSCRGPGGRLPDVFYREHYGAHYHNGSRAEGTEGSSGRSWRPRPRTGGSAMKWRGRF